MRSVFEIVQKSGIVPVVEIPDAGRAVALAATLSDAGLPVMEVTLRTSEALDAIRLIHRELPDFTVGAGTLLTPAQVDAAVEAGADFGVSPGFSPALSEAAAASGLPYIPGVATSSEIIAALAAGHTRLKFFPAERAGGARAIAALAAPFGSTGVCFMPTGGIRANTMGDYLALPSVFAIGGTWIAPKERIVHGLFDEIAAAARAARETAGRETGGSND